MEFYEYRFIEVGDTLKAGDQINCGEKKTPEWYTVGEHVYGKKVKTPKQYRRLVKIAGTPTTTRHTEGSE